MSSPDPADMGLRWDEADELPRRVHSEDGTVLLRTSDDAERLWLVLPDRREIALWLDAADHPVLGRCDAIVDAEGRHLALSSRVDWRCPGRIPAVDRPGSLPPGAGTAILNLLAWQAARAGVRALHYHGPYPSPALFGTLMQCFSVDGPTPLAEERFVQDAEARMLHPTEDPVGVAFFPDPHGLWWPQPRICVQRRAGQVDRVTIDGRAFVRSTTALCRLVHRPPSLVAAVALGGSLWCPRLSLDLDGTPHDEPHSLPPAPPSLVDTLLPAAVVEVLGEVVIRQAPRLLQPALRRLLPTVQWSWADLGDTLVRWSPEHLQLHAAMVPALPTDPATLLGVLLQLVEMPLRRAAAAMLATSWSERPG